jgi:hypothetical protein
LRTVVRRGFPELLRRKVSSCFNDCEPLLCCDTGSRDFLIEVNRDLMGAPRRVLAGGIAHELAHILHDTRMKPVQRSRALELYGRSVAYRIRDERKADLRAVERGYGEPLLAFMMYARRLGHTFCREHGLLLPELRRAVRAKRSGRVPIKAL